MPIATALMLGFGLLVFVGVGSVLGIGLWSASRNTLDLIGDKAEFTIEALNQRLLTHLRPVEEANAYLAELIASGEVDPDDRVQLADYMTGAMSATPQVMGMTFLTTDFQAVRVSRANRRVGLRVSDWSGNDAVQRVMAQAAAQADPYWGDLVWAPTNGITLINRRAPVFTRGVFTGQLVSVVAISELSRFLADAARDDNSARPFILYGRDRVLAHASMAAEDYALSAERPLPAIDRIEDPVLQRIWDEAITTPIRLKLGPATRAHRLALNGHSYAFFYREIEGYGPQILRVGLWRETPTLEQSQEVTRLYVSGGVGAAILLASVAAALFMGRRMSRPIRALAASAESIRELDFARILRVERSRLLEIDEAAETFNAMVFALRSFETYVPRALVQTLMAGDDASIRSGEREVTVLFTDIRDFTGLAESLSAGETATFLNAHFSLLGACIEAEGGTVDKYIGDSIMAFWGAPAPVEDHVQRACRAALSIRRAIDLDNERRRARGEAPVRVGVGIHTGAAIAGNIGAPGRINYTLVGDTVNIAQRLEELTKHYGMADSVEILVSAEVSVRLGPGFGRSLRGRHELRGRHGAVEVSRLD
jgi:class 3 adenylate cyclase